MLLNQHSLTLLPKQKITFKSEIMKNLIITLVFILVSSFSFSQSVWVNGYTKSNGTYVQSHYRTAPNNTVNDNYSTKGNINPYTGKKGTKPRQVYSIPTTKRYNTNTYSNGNSIYNRNRINTTQPKRSIILPRL